MRKTVQMASGEANESASTSDTRVSTNLPPSMPNVVSGAREPAAERFIDLLGTGKGMYGDDVAKYIDDLRAEWD